ncbi:hypothetical protein [Rhodococcus sp. NPDC060176]|uniref:hypothetical protein n=1 Tax=Rhodococcus sp. NPDC060176 TaxID=3347062 RepID=UPI0036509141
MLKPIADALRPADLGDRGAAIWGWYDNGTLTPDRAVLAAEAARLADRLEKCDAILRGDVDTWMKLYLPDSDDEIVIRIDTAATLSLKLASEFRQIIRQLDDQAAAPAQQKEASLADQVAAASEARKARA